MSRKHFMSGLTTPTPRRCGWRWCALVLLGLCSAAVESATYQHLTLAEAFERLEARGLKILYSSDLVKPWMRVRHEPSTDEPRAIVAQLVAPFALSAVDGPNGTVLLTRANRSRAFASRVPERLASLRAPELDLTEVIVSASRYELLQLPEPVLTEFSSDDLQMIPTLSDDPLRAVARLPGITRGDFSARVNVRGGDLDETLVRFDGLRLYDPFHLKDFQSLFSAIDPAVVRGIRVYTGGFPVAYGDRMSGVIDVVPLSADALPHREVAVSTLNASALCGGKFAAERGDWIVSGRRGNLDLLLDLADRNDSRPSYLDVYGRFGYQLSDRSTVSANVLGFEDDLLLFDSDATERATAEYRDRYFWLRLDHERDTMSGNVIFARSELDARRDGATDQDLLSRGVLHEVRAHEINSIYGNWAWRVNDRVLLHAGAEWSGSEGSYRYRDQVEFDLAFDAPGASEESEREREFRSQPRGEHMGAYTNARVQLPLDLVFEAGLRWDRETLSPQHDAGFSPRLSLVHEINPHTRLRASWGRFRQSQTINELQIADGIQEFWPAQRADHWLVGFDYLHSTGMELRVEAYRKQYRNLHPRYENLLNTFILLPELKPDRVRIDSSRATAKGIELSLRRMGDHAWRWWTGYAYSSTKDEQAGQEFYRSWDQEHTLTLGGGWRDERWDLSVAATYHTGRPTTRIALEPEGDRVVAIEPRGSSRLRSYSSLDARLARKWRFSGSTALTVFLELSNILDRRNACCIEYEVEEEEDGTRILEFEPVDALPLLPSLGFTVEF